MGYFGMVRLVAASERFASVPFASGAPASFTSLALEHPTASARQRTPIEVAPRLVRATPRRRTRRARVGPEFDMRRFIAADPAFGHARHPEIEALIAPGPPTGI